MNVRDQLGLIFREADRPKVSLEERYQAFVRDNPHVVDAFCRVALDMIDRGVGRYSADGIGHILRWEAIVQSKGEEYRVNNSYLSRMGDEFVRRYPQHEGFFERRKRRAA